MKYLILLSLLIATPLWAAEQEPKATHITVSATASTILPHDEAVVIYRIEATGKNANALRKKVNQISQHIQTSLRGEKGIKQATLSRNMQMLWRYDNSRKRQVRDGWKLVQREQLRSKRIEAVAGWVDDIESAGAHLDNLNFHVSHEAMVKAQDALRLQAIKAFRQKAHAFAKALDAKSYHIDNLRTTQGVPPVYRRNRNVDMAMMAKSANAPPPSLNAGEGKISVTVSGNLSLPYTSYPVR